MPGLAMPAGLSQRLDPRAEVDVVSLATDHERRD